MNKSKKVKKDYKKIYTRKNLKLGLCRQCPNPRRVLKNGKLSTTCERCNLASRKSAIEKTLGINIIIN